MPVPAVSEVTSYFVHAALNELGDGNLGHVTERKERRHIDRAQFGNATGLLGLEENELCSR